MRWAVVLLAMLCVGGCGSSTTRTAHQDASAVAPSSFVTKVELRCGVAYGRPRIVGVPLGSVCGTAANGARFGAIYTRRLHCAVFAVLVVDTGKYRVQGCVASATGRPTGTITCEGGHTLTVSARLSPRTQSATVLLGGGKQVSSKAVTLNAADRERWGGVYFNVLTAGMPAKAVLIERDRAGHALHRLPLVPVGQCAGSHR